VEHLPEFLLWWIVEDMRYNCARHCLIFEADSTSF